MTATPHVPSLRRERNGAARPSMGEAATRRWFPTDADIEGHIDQITQQVAKLRAAESADKAGRDAQVQAVLFKDAPVAVKQPRVRVKSQSLNEIASQAFLAMIRGLPEDHVVIQPEANREFVNRCRLLGARVSEYALNKALLNVRKAGKLHRGLVRGTAPQLDRDVMDRVGYAAEMAARLVQMRALDTGAEFPTVDRILCDPNLRSVFDDAVESIAPSFSVYEYRLAAFSYRKSGRESSMRLGRTDAPDWEVDDAPLSTLDPDDAPTMPGVYRIDAGSRTLFVSATLNLRCRLLAHLSAGDRQAVLPPCLWDPPRGKLVVRWFEAPSEWKPRCADAVAQRMKVEKKAMFNLYACAC